jgi:hypothetical protein
MEQWKDMSGAQRVSAVRALEELLTSLLHRPPRQIIVTITEADAMPGRVQIQFCAEPPLVQLEREEISRFMKWTAAQIGLEEPFWIPRAPR